MKCLSYLLEMVCKEVFGLLSYFFFRQKKLQKWESTEWEKQWLTLGQLSAHQILSSSFQKMFLLYDLAKVNKIQYF